MVSTPEVFTDNIPLDIGMTVTMKNSSARNSLIQFPALFDAKQKPLSAYWYQIKQSASQSVQAVVYCLVFLSG